MTRDDIIRMAESFGIPEFDNNESQADNILNFFRAAYAAGAAAEREACAKVCEDQVESYSSAKNTINPLEGYREQFASQQCVNAIRARGEK